MYSYLQGQRVNLQILQELQCTQLTGLLEKYRGTKALVFDEALLGPIGLVTTSTIFAELEIKLLKLSIDLTIPQDISNVIYIIRSNVEYMDIIATHIQQNKQNHLFHIIFVPRRSYLCIKHLDNKGVSADIRSIEELQWNFLPIDSDTISMELPNAYRDFTIDGDPSSLYQAALGLIQLQKLYGRIPKIYGKGLNSRKLWEYAKDLSINEKTMLKGDKGIIDQIILLDRSIDILSALATQLTYEGLIDEFFGIHQNQVKLPANLFVSQSDDVREAPPGLGTAKKTIYLNSSDKLYIKLRDKNFNEIGKILARTAKEVSSEMSISTHDKSVHDMKRLMDKLPALLAQKKSVAIHTAIAEIIRKQVDVYEFTNDLNTEQEFLACESTDKPNYYIENLIAKKSDLQNILRLICIQCAAASGLKEKVLNHYKRELVQVYGIEVLQIISSLEKAGVLRTQSESGSYTVLRKTFNLTVDDVVEIEPKDISYVHSFYAPLTVRIIEQTLKPLGWQSVKSQICNLPGPAFEDFQAQLIGVGGKQSTAPCEGLSLNIPRVVLVFFVGGCTFAEIAALRFLSQQEDNHVEFVIATTKIINKNSFLKTLM